MDFVLMKLEFPESFNDPSSSSGHTNPLQPPTFSRLASFRTIGVVMNVFLLDPSSRLLSAFVWVSSSNTIGLFALLDWNKGEYVFVDTGIECVSHPHTRVSAQYGNLISTNLAFPTVHVLELVLHTLQGADRNSFGGERHCLSIFLPHLSATELYTSIGSRQIVCP